MNTPQKRLHATIEGRVQGVGFRYFVQQQANRLGINGWVRNRWNGTVEVTAEGDEPALDKFASALQRGPQSSHVSRLDINYQEPSGEFSSFRIRRTA